MPRMAGSRPSESCTARWASSTASAPLRIEAFGLVASIQAVSFSKAMSSGRERSDSRRPASAFRSSSRCDWTMPRLLRASA